MLIYSLQLKNLNWFLLKMLSLLTKSVSWNNQDQCLMKILSQSEFLLNNFDISVLEWCHACVLY